MRLRWLLTVGGALSLLLGLAPAQASAEPVSTIVASGLDNPRGLAFANSKLLVAEAGVPGDVCNTTIGVCVGLSGKISRVNLATHSHKAIVSGLISVQEFGDVLGVSGLSAREGEAQAIIGAYPQAAAAFDCNGNAHCNSVKAAAQAQLGQLIEIKRGGGYEAIAGVGSNDYLWTLSPASPPGQEKDSNPYGVLMAAGGTWVADAGSNVLVWVTDEGGINIKHWFEPPAVPLPHNFPRDAVPTCVAHRNGGLFVGDLAGRGWQGNGNGTGFAQLALNGTGKHLTGCTTDGAGNVLFVNMGDGTFAPGTGSIVKLDKAGNTSVLLDKLNYPNMITMGPDGNLYVTINSTCPGAGGTGACAGKTGSVIRVAYNSGDDQNDETQA